MFDTALIREVEIFADIMKDVPDAVLDRKWVWGAYEDDGVRFAFLRIYEDLRQLTTKIAVERSAQRRAISTAQQILADHHATFRELQAALIGIGDDEAAQIPNEGEWPLIKIITHLLEVEVRFFVVIKYALDRHRSGKGRLAEVPDGAREAILGQDWPSLQAVLMDPAWGRLLSFLEAFHKRVLWELADISEEELALPSMSWEGYPMSLQFRLHRFDSHMQEHIVQVDKTLVNIGCAPNEARRFSRLIYRALADLEGATIGAWEVGLELGNEMAKTIAGYTEEVLNILRD